MLSPICHCESTLRAETPSASGVRIAFVVHDFQREFGQGRYTYELARRFASEHEVHVFANVFDEAGTQGVQFHHVPAIRNNALSTVITFLAPATAKVGTGWDVIHAQGLTCLRFNVITAHICNASLARAQRDARVARSWRQRAFERIVTPLEHAAYRYSTNATVIAISGQVRTELAKRYGRTAGVNVIRHGVDSELFSPATRLAHRARSRAELGLGEGDFAALFVGDLRRGAAVALEAASHVPALRLILVSRSDPAPFVEKARALGLGDRAVFRPSTTHVERAYAAADAFVFPSPYDAFGMVISEAMAMGLPVVVSRQAGASELIDPGVSGFVHDAWDVASPAAHLQKLMDDTGLATEMGAAARSTVVEHTWDNVARLTMRLYEAVRRR